MPEIFIALMGVTGAGKSSFIKLCLSGTQEVKIGHTLDPCTAVVDVYRCQYDQNTIINLIDTPGFDDANRTDTEVLRQITPWLTKTYRKNIQLSGIIYLHRITDPRMQGSSIRNLGLFKALCGSNALKNVILATSMWDKVEESDGQQREDQLRNKKDWWGSMCDSGSTIVRHNNTAESARRILQRFVTKPPVVLEIQHELVDLDKRFDDTDVGKTLNKDKLKLEAEFEQKRREFEEGWRQASKEKDQETMNLFTQLQDQIQAERQKQHESHRQLQISMDQIQQEQRRYRDMEQRFQASEDNRRREVDQLRKQLEQYRSNPGNVTTQTTRRRSTQDASVMQAAVPASSRAPAPAPVPASEPKPRSAQPKRSTHSQTKHGSKLWCSVKHKTKLSHWLGSSAPREVMLEMFILFSDLDDDDDKNEDFRMPSTKKAFLNLLRSTYSEKIKEITWEVKEDIQWDPRVWFPESYYFTKDSSSLGPFGTSKNIWITELE